MTDLRARVVGLAEARRRFGPRADAIAAWFDVGDPAWPIHDPPDRVPAPEWLDVARCDRGGLTLRRHGLLTAAVLRSYSLPLSYLSGVGIEPLLATGQLLERAPARLYRTADFVIETQKPGGMQPDGRAWQTAARIRSVHQRVRKQLLAKGWSPRLGPPLPQPDVAATALLFGPMLVEGLRRLGARITADEADDVAHLARGIAHGQGVVPELQARGHDEAVTLFAMLTALNHPPGSGSRALAAALLDIPHQLATSRLDRLLAPAVETLNRSLSVFLLGQGEARSLGIRGDDRLARVVAKLACGPQHHPRLAPLHDRLADWVLERGRRRLGKPKSPRRRAQSASAFQNTTLWSSAP